jgi:RND family efflux transporter MFP subunit
MPVGVAGEGGQVVRVLVEPGQWVGAGQTLAVIDRSVQTQQAAGLAASIRVSQADANLAQAELERAEALVSRGFISKADMDRKRATRDAANARVRVAQAQYAEANARNSRLNIVAPAAGLVLTRQVEPGQIVSSGSGVLFRMARGGEMEMMAQMAEADLQRVRVGTRATVTPVGTDLKIAGQVWQVSPIINADTRQGMVRIAVPYSGAMRPGGFADARLVSGTAEAPLLPESAVQSGPEGNYVLIVGNDNKIQRKPVKVGTVTDDGVSIASGLTGVERIVVLAGAFLNIGDKVKPVLLKSSR